MTIDLHEDRALERRPRVKEACILLQGMALELGPEAKLPTILELQAQLGMSVKTLASAVRELEQRQVLRSVNGVGIYVARENKRALTGNIGFMTSGVLDYIQNMTYWGLIWAGIRAKAAESGRHFLFIDNVETFNNWEKIDGLVLDDMSPVRVLAKPPKSLPCISLLNPMPGIACVGADDFRGAYLATRHLISLGHTRIAYLSTLSTQTFLLDQRRKGYLAALKESGIEPEEGWLRDLHMTGNFFQSSELTMHRWLATDWDKIGCTALVTQNDEIATGVIAAINAVGLKVPGDISVTGFDGIPSHPQSQPRLTSIKVPLFDIGQTAATLLFDWMENPGRVPQDTYLPVTLLRGESSAPPHARD
jgi:DNA-binding LacI/PurR family transcriptional regulator